MSFDVHLSGLMGTVFLNVMPLVKSRKEEDYYIFTVKRFFFKQFTSLQDQSVMKEI